MGTATQCFDLLAATGSPRLSAAPPAVSSPSMWPSPPLGGGGSGHRPLGLDLGAPLLPPPLLPPASARSEARAPAASRSASLGVLGLEALPASVATADGELQGAPMSCPAPFTPLLHYPHPLALALPRTSTRPAHSRLAITPRPQLQPTPPPPAPSPHQGATMSIGVASDVPLEARGEA